MERQVLATKRDIPDSFVGPRPGFRGPPARSRTGHGRRVPGGSCSWAVWGLVLGLGLTWFSVVAPGGDDDRAPFRLGFSTSTFGEVNQNDVMAAMKLWIDSLSRETQISLAPKPEVLNGIGDITRVLRERQLDAVSLTSDEYWALRDQLADDLCILGVKNESVTEEFVVVVRRDRGWSGIENLRGCQLIQFDSPRMRVARPWLETLILEGGGGTIDRFIGSMEGRSRLAQVVLSVFFQKADAGLVTRAGFDTMVEMNPQLGRDLTILRSSPPIIPYLFAFRADYAAAVRAQVLDKVSRWHLTVSGRQILTAFQCDRVEAQPISLLDDTLKLLDRHSQLIKEGGLLTGAGMASDLGGAEETGRVN